MKLTPTLFATALLLSLTLQAEAKKIKLQYQLKAGQEFSITSSANQEMAQEVMGQTTTLFIETSNTYAFKVIEVKADGTFRLSGTMTETILNSSSTMGMGDMKFNSTTDKEVPEAVKPMILTLNEPYLFTLSPAGAISDVLLPEGMQEKIEKNLTEQQDAAGQIVNASLSAVSTAEGFAKTMGGFFIALPTEPVQKKDNWSVESKMEQTIQMTAVTEYTYSGTADGCHNVKWVSQITQTDPAASMEIMGMNARFELSGALDGMLKLNEESCLVEGGESITSISGVISIESSELPAPMSIPMSTKTTIRITRK